MNKKFKLFRIALLTVIAVMSLVSFSFAETKAVYWKYDRDQLGDGYIFYLDRLNVIENHGDYYTVEYKGNQYDVSRSDVLEEIPDYTKGTDNPMVKQAITNAMKYIRAKVKTVYYSKGDGKVYSGEDSIYDKDVYAFDCSGFVLKMIEPAVQKYVPVYKMPVGCSALNSASSLYNIGYKKEFKVQTINRNDLQPGDLILFSRSGTTVSHVGMYLGNGDFIHSTHGYGNANRVDGEYTVEHRYGGVFVSKLDEAGNIIVKCIRVIPSVEEAKASGDYFYVKKAVTLKKSASTSAGKLTTVKAGQYIKLKYADAKNKWYVVSAGSKTGYLYAKNDKTKISDKCMQNCEISVIPEVIYNGKAQKPEVAVYYKGSQLSTGSYTVSYSKNKEVGTAKITIKGNSKKGFYGSTTAEFDIKAKE